MKKEKTADYFNLLFLATTALRKFAYRSGFNRIVADSPKFGGNAPNQTAKNRLTYLKGQQGWLSFKRLAKRKTVYYLTEKGLGHLKTILSDPFYYYSDNQEAAQWIQKIGLNQSQLPENAFNPGNRDFGVHEQLCDEFSTAWTSVIGCPLPLVAKDHSLKGIIDFAWCLTEPSIKTKTLIVGKESISPDVLLYFNGTVGGQRFTRIAYIEVEVSTKNCVEKFLSYSRWFWTGEFRQFYREQKGKFPLGNHRCPPLIVGFIFCTQREENQAREQLREITFSSMGLNHKDFGLLYHLQFQMRLFNRQYT